MLKLPQNSLARDPGDVVGVSTWLCRRIRNIQREPRCRLFEASGLLKRLYSSTVDESISSAMRQLLSQPPVEMPDIGDPVWTI